MQGPAVKTKQDSQSSQHELGSRLTRHRLLVKQLGEKLATWEGWLTTLQQELHRIPGYVRASFFLCDALRPDLPHIERLCERLGQQVQRLREELDHAWREYGDLIGHVPHDRESTQNAKKTALRQQPQWRTKAHRTGCKQKPPYAEITSSSPWRYVPDQVALHHLKSNLHLWLGRCDTNAGVLDMLTYAESKVRERWLSTEDLGYLLHDIVALLNPFETLCSWGKDLGPITDLRQVIENNRKEPPAWR